MKVAVLISRILLGLLFLIFGLNGFFNFIPQPPPVGVAGQFGVILQQTHYFLAVAAFEVVGAVLLLANRFVPLGLTLLGPILVNILLFHILMAPMGLPIALVVTLLWFIVFTSVRQAFAGIFLQRV